MITTRIFDSSSKAKDVLSKTLIDRFSINPDCFLLDCGDGLYAYSPYQSFEEPYKAAKLNFKLFKDDEYKGFLSVTQSDVSDFYDDEELVKFVTKLYHQSAYHKPAPIKDYVNGDQFDNGAVKGTVKNVNGDEVTVETTNDKDEKKDVVVNQQTGDIKPVSDSVNDLDTLHDEVVRQLDQTGIASVEIPSDVSDEDAYNIAYMAALDDFFQENPIVSVEVIEGVRKLKVIL